MKTPSRFIIVAATLAASLLKGEDQARNGTKVIPRVFISTRHPEYRNETERFTEVFFGHLSVETRAENPKDGCVWVDQLTAPMTIEGWVVFHFHGCGTTISVTSTQQLAKAVDKLISLSRGEKLDKKLPQGVFTSFHGVRDSQ
jgi:hypothetical protein